MALSLTYDSVLSRVRIAASGAPSAADNMKVERSTDQIVWTTVRGGAAVPLAAGAATLDDYEFTSDVANYYRVSYVDTAAITFVSVGTATTGNNTSVTPGAPAGFVAGDLLVILASIRNSGVGTVNTPTGWTVMHTFGNVTMLGKRAVGGDAMPTVTFTGGVLNADTIVQCSAFRNAELAPVTSVQQLNGSAQNVDRPALTVPQDNMALIRWAWKQDDWASITTPVSFANIGTTSTVTGDDAALGWFHWIQTAKSDLPSGTHSVTGGAAAISRAGVVALRMADYVTRETANITPALDGVWLKSLARPFLNVPVTVTDWSDVERASRSGVFPIVGRSFPVAVTDLHGSRRWTLDVRAETEQEAKDLDLLISTGEVQFVHTPTVNCRVPGGYVALGDTAERRPRPRATRRIIALPLTEVAAPGPDVIPAVGTWQSVINTYPTWADVLAAHPTWDSLLQLVGSPGDVIVP